MDQPIFEGVKFDLANTDANVFNLIGIASGKARKAKIPPEKIKEFQTEAMSGDYDHVIQTIMRYFDCSGDDED
jgi:hypothetical protein